MLEQDQLNIRLIKAVKDGDAQALVQALAEGGDANAHGAAALWRAAEKGHSECVRLLIPVIDSLADRFFALSMSTIYGHEECVKLLIPVSDPRLKGSLALRQAAQYGHAECVRLLIPVSDPLAGGSMALLWGAASGHAECAELLLPVSDPLAVDREGLTAAALARKNGHMDVAGMIESFIESQALSGGLSGAPRGSVAKKLL